MSIYVILKKENLPVINSKHQWHKRCNQHKNSPVLNVISQWKRHEVDSQPTEFEPNPSEGTAFRIEEFGHHGQTGVYDNLRCKRCFITNDDLIRMDNNLML